MEASPTDHKTALENIVDRFHGIAEEDLTSEERRILNIAMDSLGNSNAHVVKVKEYWKKESAARNVFYV